MQYTQEQISDILTEHRKWIYGEGGSRADLRDADLHYADLRRADLRDADMSCADLRDADLRDADLRRADLSDADLRRADLSGVKNLLSSSDWMSENFQSAADGYEVYKAIGRTNYKPPSYWKIEADSYLAEVCSPDRCADCACGVNFGTLEWVKNQYPDTPIWKCLIEWRDLPGVVVPYHADGKARCERLKLIKVFQ